MAWPLLGSCGAFCLDAHQTTAASAISDKKSCMSAKRRFMTGTGARAGSHGGGEGLVQQAASPGQPAEGPDGSRRCRYPEPPPVRSHTHASAPSSPPTRIRPRAVARGPGPRPGTAARSQAGGPEARAQSAHPRGPERTHVARRPLVFPSRRRLRGRSQALLRTALTRRLDGHQRAERVECHRHDAEPLLGRLVPQGVHPAERPEGPPLRLEGSLPERQPARRGVAQRQEGGRQRRGYLPFEVDLKGLRRGRNTLVVKVSSLRSSTDLTHWRPAAFNGYGSGGWWNFGGLLREVYVRPVEGVDIENVLALPRLARLRGPARVVVKVRARNLTRRNRKVDFALNVSGPGTRQRVVPRSQGVGGRGTRDLRFSFTIPRPRLWQPGRPALYSLAVGAGIGGRRLAAYRLSFGVKKLERGRGGRLLLNGRQLRLRGASIHEDDPRTGGASTAGERAALLGNLRTLGATVTRSHYPLHPAFLEALDRAGILYWSQAPVYQLPNSFLDRRGVRAAAISVAKRTVFNNANHASVFVWSIGNELGGNREERGRIGSGLARYIREASREVRRLDNTRMVGIDRQSRIGEVRFNPALARLDVLGVNEYFGWYDSNSSEGPPSRTDQLGAFLDSVHRTYPRMPLVLTEYGAEASRSGPREQKGTFEFQTDFMRRHLAIHASKRYINGSIAWALKDFRVDPSWLGGAPREYATPPWHNKSLIDESGARKPAFVVMQRLWRRTKPLR